VITFERVLGILGLGWLWCIQMWSVLEIRQISMGQESASEKANHLKALKKKFEAKIFI